MDPAKIEQLASITGCDAAKAQHLLEASNWDVGAAVNLHFSEGAAPASVPPSRPQAVPRKGSTGSASSQAALHNPGSASRHAEPEVRAPIAPKRDILVGPVGRRASRRKSANAYGEERGNLAFRNLRQEATSRKRLKPDAEDADKPDHALRTRAVQQGRWILVNIQSEKEFQSHVLNRDIWSSKRIREQLKGNFLLWQQYSTSSHGIRFRASYPFTSLPHIAILNPRTGERLKQFPELVTESTFLEGLFDFLADHSLDANRPKAAEGNSASSSPPVASPSSHEQEELRRAIAASLANEDVVVVEDGENQSAEALPDSTSKVTSSASLLFPGRNLANHSIGSQVVQAVLKSEPPKDSTQPLATLRFIFPDSSRLQRRFFADETLQAVFEFVKQHQATAFDLVTGHPKRTLAEESHQETLLELKLLRETIHVQSRL